MTKLCDTCIYGDKYELEKPCVIYSDDCKLYEEKNMDDMTRKCAISELEQIYGMLSSDKQRALDMAINSLKVDEQYDLAMEQAEPTGWIPVSERDETLEYIVCQIPEVKHQRTNEAEIKQWRKLLGSKKPKHTYDPTAVKTVKVIQGYTDIALNQFLKVGEIHEMPIDRVQVVVDAGFCEVVE